MDAKQEFYTKINDILPTIQEGLVITKDYAFDLFNRYISYLIIVDWLMTFTTMVISILTILIWYKIHKKKEDIDITIFVCWICACILLITIPFMIYFWNMFIQDIFIPEVRIFEIYNK